MGDGYRQARDALAVGYDLKRCVVQTFDTTPEIHRQLTIVAEETGKTFDDLINAALLSFILRHHMRQDLRNWYAQNGGTPVQQSPDDWGLDETQQ